VGMGLGRRVINLDSVNGIVVTQLGGIDLRPRPLLGACWRAVTALEMATRRRVIVGRSGNHWRWCAHTVVGRQVNGSAYLRHAPSR
jgi:hypothetical protein